MRSCSTRRASVASADPMSISIAAICMRCWSTASHPARSPSIISSWAGRERRRGAPDLRQRRHGRSRYRHRRRRHPLQGARILLGAEPPQFFGAAAYRAIFPAERLKGLRIPDCTKWWGTDRHCLPYYLTGRRDEVYAIGVVPVSHWDGDEASVPATREQYLASFPASMPICNACCRPWTASACGRSTIAAQRLLERRPRTDGATGRRVPSDAALHGGGRRHGSGGCRDLEPLPGNLRRPRGRSAAMATRISRVGEVQRISLDNTWMGGPTDTDWFYCYDACTAPLEPP